MRRRSRAGCTAVPARNFELPPEMYATDESGSTCATSSRHASSLTSASCAACGGVAALVVPISATPTEPVLNPRECAPTTFSLDRRRSGPRRPGRTRRRGSCSRCRSSRFPSRGRPRCRARSTPTARASTRSSSRCGGRARSCSVGAYRGLRAANLLVRVPARARDDRRRARELERAARAAVVPAGSSRRYSRTRVDVPRVRNWIAFGGPVQYARCPGASAAARGPQSSSRRAATRSSRRRAARAEPTACRAPASAPDEVEARRRRGERARDGSGGTSRDDHAHGRAACATPADASRTTALQAKDASHTRARFAPCQTRSCSGKLPARILTTREARAPPRAARSRWSRRPRRRRPGTARCSPSTSTRTSTRSPRTGSTTRSTRRRRSYDALVIVLDTPGGLAESMRKIVQKELVVEGSR